MTSGWTGQETLNFKAQDAGNLWSDEDAVLFTVSAAKNKPTVTSPIPDQDNDADFSAYDIDLQNVFEDAETADS
mgnify:CR=1 FL=1